MKSLGLLCGGYLLFLSLGLFNANSAEPEDASYDVIVYGTNKFTNVRILQSSPVDLLLGHDAGHLRIPLQKLPEPLKSKYPYSAEKAAEFKKEQEEKVRRHALQDRAVINQQLLAREAQLRQQIDKAQEDLKRINKNIATESQLPKSSQKRQTLSSLRSRKLATRDLLWKLQDDLKQTQQTRQKYGI